LGAGGHRFEPKLTKTTASSKTFGVFISEGRLHYLLNLLAKKGTADFEKIRQFVMNSTVITLKLS